MYTTASKFTLRKNAKRAAAAMIRKGIAPATEYTIRRIDKPGKLDDGRFEIVWNTEEAETAVTEGDVVAAEENWSEPGVTTDEVEAELEAATEPAAAATGPAPAEGAPEHAPSAEAAPERAPAPADGDPEPDPFPVGAYVHVQLGRLRIHAGHITQRVGHANRRVHLLGAAEGVTQLVDVAQLYRVEEKPMPAEESKPARQRRRDQATAAPQGTRSRYGINPDLIAGGRLPDKAPEVTSAANRRYQTHFDKLLELANAGDWDAVRKYEVTGSNSYSKMVARYRQDLLAVHAAGLAKAGQ
jgi:hypothetical protein